MAARKRPARSELLPGAQPAAERQETSVEMGWRTWRAAYREQYGTAYSTCTPDGHAMKAVIMAAEEDIAAHGRPPADLEALVSHRWAAYLEDRGHEGKLADNRHPMHWFGHGVAKYGTPWDPPRWEDDEGPLDPPGRERRPPDGDDAMHPEVRALLKVLTAAGEQEARQALAPRSLRDLGFVGPVDWSKQPGGRPVWARMPKKLPGREDGR